MTLLSRIHDVFLIEEPTEIWGLRENGERKMKNVRKKEKESIASG